MSNDRTYTDMQREAWAIADGHGWHDEERSIPELLCLIHSEVSEALECYRENKATLCVVDGKPEGIQSELADVVIRVMDMSETLGFNLENVIMQKMEYNRSRPYRHGGKIC